VEALHFTLVFSRLRRASRKARSRSPGRRFGLPIRCQDFAKPTSHSNIPTPSHHYNHDFTAHQFRSLSFSTKQSRKNGSFKPPRQL
jgi:hypothetical protein